MLREFVEVKGINQDFQESNTPQSIIRSAVQVATPARQERLGVARSAKWKRWKLNY